MTERFAGVARMFGTSWGGPSEETARFRLSTHWRRGRGSAAMASSAHVTTKLSPTWRSAL